MFFPILFMTNGGKIETLGVKKLPGVGLNELNLEMYSDFVNFGFISKLIC